MPMDLSSDQISALISQLEVVTSTFLYGLRANKGSLMQRQLEMARKKDNKNYVDLCNCWEAILFAAQKAGLGHTIDDINASSAIVGSTKVMAVYLMANRRFIMFPNSGRKEYGIPSGMARRGDVLMYGAGKHVFLNTSEQLVQSEPVLEFERGVRRGVIHFNELEANHSSDLLICAPIPSPGELPALAARPRSADIRMFTEADQAELRRAGFD